MARRDKYDIAKIRSQVKKRIGKHTDPAEFKPPKAEEGKLPIQFRFFILPPFEEGDELASGSAEQGMEEFFLRNGSHYIDNKRLGCPRVIEDDKCGICQHGFDLMGETTVKEERAAIAKRLLPGTYYMVNIYFPAVDKNPEELRGQVKWYNCPKTVFDMWEECLFRDDDGGDPLEPLPFGVFYDEEEAYLFRLEVVRQGQGNNYGKSKFFLTESLQSVPIAGKSGKPNADEIAKILAQRHDLFDKLPDVVPADIDRVVRNLTGEEGDSGGGFDADETKPAEAPADTRKAKEDARKAKKKGLKPNVSESSAKPKEEPVTGEIPADEVPFEAEAEAEAPAAEADSDDDDVDSLLDQLGDG